MASNAEPDLPADRLVLPAKLSAMERLPPWIEAIAKSTPIDDRTQFAIHLCLEEAVSNVIRHGHAETATEATVTIAYAASPDGHLVFTVEDNAPPFNPLAAPVTPIVDANGEIPIGGHGIRLLRSFAGSLDYEPIPTGNRLRIGFVMGR
jgi:serine/threonine-protein kinase RsbW